MSEKGRAHKEKERRLTGGRPAEITSRGCMDSWVDKVAYGSTGKNASLKLAHKISRRGRVLRCAGKYQGG